MKKMTCREMGGCCDAEIMANSSVEMARKMTSHVLKMHPGVADKMKHMTTSQHEAWERDFNEHWDHASAA